MKNKKEKGVYYIELVKDNIEFGASMPVLPIKHMSGFMHMAKSNEVPIIFYVKENDNFTLYAMMGDCVICCNTLIDQMNRCFDPGQIKPWELEE